MSKASEILHNLISIEEGVNDNYLYHWSPLIRLIKIARDGELKTSRNGYLSLTRDKNITRTSDDRGMHYLTPEAGQSCLVLDRRKLSYNYKLEPYEESGVPGKSEAEERIKRPITNLSRYAVKVILSRDFVECLYGDPDDYSECDDARSDVVGVLDPDHPPLLSPYDTLNVPSLEKISKYFQSTLGVRAVVGS